MKTYEVILITEAIQRDLPGAKDRWYKGIEEGWIEDWTSAIWIVQDGVPIEILAEDGGEPEDQYFDRGLGWIAPALQRAYDEGCLTGAFDSKATASQLGS